MSKFRYRMQNILNIKQSLENQAKMQYSEAASNLRSEEEKLLMLRNKKASYEEEAARLLTDSLKIREINENNRAILFGEEEIKEQIKAVASAERALERARVKMTEAMRERKTQEKLKERAFEEFLLEVKAAEGKEIDELTSYTYGRRIEDEGK